MEVNVSNNLAEEQEVEVVEEELQEEEVSQEPQQEQQEAKSEDEELSEYSKNVQRRIKKINDKFRQEEAERKAAVEYAEAVKKQNDELKERLDKLDQSYVGEFGTRVESQIATAKQAYQKAFDEGDADAMFEAQKNLSQLALDQAQLAQTKKQQEQRMQMQEQQAQQPQPQAQPQAQPDPKAESWASKNDWFGTDQTMTYAAFGIHRQLIEEEGFDPSSDEYYSELDNRVRREFPHKFNEPSRSSGPRVASAESTASKSVSKGRRTVKLTPSQIAIAKRLNVPLEEYAKYVKE
jgi:hypothetical protein